MQGQMKARDLHEKKDQLQENLQLTGSFFILQAEAL